MKCILYFILGIIAFFLFVPKTGTTEIRNLPILIALLSLIVGYMIFKLIKRIVFMHKVKKKLKGNDAKIIKTHFNPFAARLHGRYSVTFKINGKIINALLLIRKRKYQRYHFESCDQLEFYRSNRVVFQSTKMRGATVSDLVETKKVGRQPLKWDEADRNIIIFNKIPDHITDSKQKELLGNGYKVCGTETYIADVESFLNFLDANDN